MKHLVAPSILAADFSILKKELEFVERSNADWLHVDVMDGVFVPNISFGQMIIKEMRKHISKPMDVHLMIVEPEKYIESIRDCGADIITVHYEACNHLHRVIQQIKATGAKAGVAINPHTSITLLEDVLEELDLVCIMSVNPGFGGQKFIYQSIPKIRKLRTLLEERNLKVLIEVDGGVGLQNAEKILEAGANVLVAGSSVFKSPDREMAVDGLKAFGSENIMT